MTLCPVTNVSLSVSPGDAQEPPAASPVIFYHRRLVRTQRMPSRRKLPYFRCRCGARLAQMDVVQGRTCVRLGPDGVAFKQVFVCERCGREREFISMAT